MTTKSVAHKKTHGFVYEMVIHGVISKNFLFINIQFYFKRISGCNPSMTDFITHWHCIEW